MNIRKVVTSVICFACAFLMAGMTLANAASYDIKRDVKEPAYVADMATITADKVMGGVVDITLTMRDSGAKVTQRVMLQCDTTQQTVTAFYYMDNIMGYKAGGANGFQVNVYGTPADGYYHNGDVKVYDSSNVKDNLRKSFNRMKKLDGTGFISFEFTETKGDIDHNTVAHSMMLPATYLNKIFAAMDKYPDADGCSIDGGFVSVYPLKNLTDEI